MKTKILFFIVGCVTTIVSVYLVQHFDKQGENLSIKSLNAEVRHFDTDNDGKDENIILYNCRGCNAPPRELTIIDDGELVFFYEGGELQFIPIEPGLFTIREINVPRDGRLIENKYRYNIQTTDYTKL